MSKEQRKIRNFLLKTITWLCAILFFLSACMIDSASMVPTIVCIFTGAWLCLFAYANKELAERMVKENA